MSGKNVFVFMCGINVRFFFRITRIMMASHMCHKTNVMDLILAQDLRSTLGLCHMCALSISTGK